MGTLYLISNLVSGRLGQSQGFNQLCYEFNAMILAYTTKLGFSSQKTNVKVKKIDSINSEMYRMTSAKFSI